MLLRLPRQARTFVARNRGAEAANWVHYSRIDSPPHAKLRPTMNTPLVNRRTLLQASAVAAGCWSLPILLPAAEPPERPENSRFKLSLAAYSFHKSLQRGWPTGSKNDAATMTMEDFIDFCATQPLDGAELTGYYFPAEVTTDYLNAIKRRLFLKGLDVSGTAIGNDFCLPAGAARDAQIAMTRQWIRIAAELGAPVIRIFAGQVPKGDTEQAARDRCIAGINAVLPDAAQAGVFLALENHGGITATAEQMLAIVHGVDKSPWFGVNLDGGNFKTADPYYDLECIVPYAVNVQIKVTVFPNGQRQPADYARILNMLRKVHFRGYIVLEYEEPEDPRIAIPPLLKTLRDLF